MRSMFFVVASLALLAVCVCAPEGASIQHIPPKAGETPSAIGKDGAVLLAAAGGAGSSKHMLGLHVARTRRDLAGQESDLLPSANQAEASVFGESSNLDGRGRIRVLPAFLG